MTKSVRAIESIGATVGVVILVILGVVLLFAFPIGSFFGIILLFAAPKIANRTKNVWLCSSCGYFLNERRPLVAALLLQVFPHPNTLRGSTQGA
jgi:hypothetical protein